MHLEQLNLFNFRNYSRIRLEFDRGVQCLVGTNGSGKTNLLDAIHYLAFTKSSLEATDAQNVRHGEQMFSIKGRFEMDELRNEVTCTFEPDHRKVVSENGKEYKKFSEHIGRYPLVLVAPHDIELIWNGGEIRRRFFDTLISQIDKDYLEQLIKYNACLKMRNSMLRLFSDRGQVQYDLLESCDQQLVVSGEHIARVRKKFVIDFLPLLSLHYQSISGGEGQLAALEYRSGSDDMTLEELLKRNIERDIALQRTTAGAHRDDFIFLLNGYELKRYGSQGQQKSFLIGLKLAEFETISNCKGFKPILLLDDIFDKLDDERISGLVKLVTGGAFGQLFITDARPDRSRQLLKNAGVTAAQFEVEYGNLVKS